MVNRCVKDRQRSPSGRHLIFLVTFNPINPACSLTTHLWVLTEDPNRHIFNTRVTRCKFVCLGWAKFRGTRRLAVPGQSDLYQSKWYTACLMYQKGIQLVARISCSVHLTTFLLPRHLSFLLSHGLHSSQQTALLKSAPSLTKQKATKILDTAASNASQIVLFRG